MKKKNRLPDRDARKERFLESLGEGSSVGRAAAAAGVARRTVYKWRSSDEAFAASWAEAENAGTDVIEDEAFRRAIDGVEKPVIRSGQVVGHVRDYSDAMLTMILKARRPEKYGGKQAADKDDISDFKGARETLFSKFAKIFSSGKDKGVSE